MCKMYFGTKKPVHAYQLVHDLLMFLMICKVNAKFKLEAKKVKEMLKEVDRWTNHIMHVLATSKSDKAKLNWSTPGGNDDNFLVVWAARTQDDVKQIKKDITSLEETY